MKLITSTLCALLLAGAAFAQSPVAGIDYPSPIPTPFIGFTTGTSDPELCYPGLSPNNFRTDLNLMKICTSRNTWSVNLSSNAPMQPATAGSTTLGTALLPFSAAYLGTAATNNLELNTAGFTSAYDFTFCEPTVTTRAFCIADPADSTKNFLVDVSGDTTGKNSILAFTDAVSRVYTFPDPGGPATVAFTNPTATQNIVNTGVITPIGGIAQASSTVPFTQFTSPVPPLVALMASSTDPGALLVGLTQIFVPTNDTLTGVCALQGSGANTDKWLGILYSAAGVALANSATAGVLWGTSSTLNCQAFVTPVAVVGPSTYYVGIQTNGTTGNEIYLYSTGSLPTNYGCGQVAAAFGTVAAVSVPTTFTTAKCGPVGVY